MIIKKLLMALLSVAAIGSAQSAFAAAEEFPIPNGFHSAYETIDHVKLHYVEGGSGPLVFLVHGFGQSWYEWHHLMPLLAKTHTVVAVDLSGLGESEPPKTGYAGSEVYVHISRRNDSRNSMLLIQLSLVACRTHVQRPMVVFEDASDEVFDVSALVGRR